MQPRSDSVLQQNEAGDPSRPVTAMEDQCFNPAKLFVGGLGQQSTEKSLQAYFGRFGPVKDAVVIVDRTSGRSRGFGFVVFDSHDVIEQCLDCRHNIDGVSCEVRRAVPRDEARGALPYDSVEQPGKVYVGGLPENVTESRIREYFAYYGPIRNVTLMYDKNSHRPRGFGFVVFENLADASKCWGPHPALGRMVEAKKAEPRPESRKSCSSGPNNCGRFVPKPTWASKGPGNSPYSTPPSGLPKPETPTTSASSDAPRILTEWGSSWNALPPLRQSFVTDTIAQEEDDLYRVPHSHDNTFYPVYENDRDPYKRPASTISRPLFDFERASIPMQSYDSISSQSPNAERYPEVSFGSLKNRDSLRGRSSEINQQYYPPSFSKSVSVRRHAGRSNPY